MAIYNGSNKIKTLYLGSNKLKAAYLGGTNLWKSALPATLYNGTTVASELGSWRTTDYVYEGAWVWDYNHTSTNAQKDNLWQFVSYASVSNRAGGSIYSANKVDLSGNSSITVIAGRNGNTYCRDGTLSDAGYVYFSLWIAGSIGGAPSAVTTKKCASGIGVFTRHTLKLDIPNGTESAYIGISAYNTDNEGNSVAVYSLTAAE